MDLSRRSVHWGIHSCEFTYLSEVSDVAEVSHLFVLCLISQSTKMMKLLNQGSQQEFYL